MKSKLASMAMLLLGKLVTEAFLTEILLSGLKKLAQSTDNKLDDEIVESVKKALGASK